MPGDAKQSRRRIYKDAIAKYNLKAYDRVELKVRKDSSISKDSMKNHAKLNGESLNGFICRAIASTMERDNKLRK